MANKVYSKIWIWVSIILAGLIIHLWGREIADFAKISIGYLAVFYEKRVLGPVLIKLYLPIRAFNYYWHRAYLWWKHTRDPILKIILAVVFLILFALSAGIFWVLLIIFYALLWIVMLVLWGLKGVMFMFFWILDKSRQSTLTGYIILIAVLAFFLGKFFYSKILPWITNKVNYLFLLTFGDIYYLAKRGEKKKIISPVCLTLSLIMIFLLIFRVFYLPFWDKASFLKGSIIYWTNLEEASTEQEKESLSLGQPYKSFLENEGAYPFLCRFYERPDSSSPIAGSYNCPEKLITLRRYLKPLNINNKIKEEWFLIVYNDKIGWVYGGKIEE